MRQLSCWMSGVRASSRGRPFGLTAGLPQPASWADDLWEPAHNAQEEVADIASLLRAGATRTGCVDAARAESAIIGGRMAPAGCECSHEAEHERQSIPLMAYPRVSRDY